MTLGRARFAFTVLAFGYAFLYLPIVLVIAYSFNESRLVTVWAGFSTNGRACEMIATRAGQLYG